MEGVSPVLGATEGLEEWAKAVVEETADTHPDLVEVPSDDPGWGKESWWFNELYEVLRANKDIPF